MSDKVRDHIRGNVYGLIAIFIALGGTAYASHGAPNSISSEDIINGQVKSADVGNGAVTGGDISDNTLLGGHIVNGTLGTNDYGDASVVGLDIADNTLLGGHIVNGALGTNDYGDGSVVGLDIANSSITGNDIDEAEVNGLDRCPSGTTRFDQLCVGSDGQARDFVPALRHCADSPGGLRLPGYAEAVSLARTHDVPGIADGEQFWSDHYYLDRDEPDLASQVVTVRESGVTGNQDYAGDSAETVCVTTPRN